MTVAERTIHKRIQSDIAEHILSGRWSPGRRIPTEKDLMVQYGCSRMTVSKALTPLVDGGLIVRRRRAGTFVARQPIHSAVLDIPDIQTEITSRGEPYGYQLLSRAVRAANGQDDIAWARAVSGPVLALECLHLAGGRPFALEKRLISLSAVPEAEAVDFQISPPGAWLLGSVPWTEAEHKISAINVSRLAARLLSIEVSVACLCLERKTWRGHDPVTHARLTFPGSAYDLVARFVPRGGRG